MIRPYAALFAAAAFLALPACAQPAPQPTHEPKQEAQQQAAGKDDADPALWVVKDEDTTIYLFGTIHVLRPGLTWFDEAVKSAFDGAGTLVLEMVEPDEATQQQVVGARAFTANQPPLSTRLPEKYRETLTRTMAEAKVPPSAYERMRPWFAALTLSIAPVQKMGYDAAYGPETVLTQAARNAGKQVTGLETFEGQLGLFDSLSDKGQMALLTSTMDELPDAPRQMERMVTDWAAGNPDGLAREINASLKSSPEVAKTLLTERNRRWAKWVAERMRMPGVVFVAVGAGHLAGNGSVQDELKPYKLQAVRVRY